MLSRASKVSEAIGRLTDFSINHGASRQEGVLKFPAKGHHAPASTGSFMEVPEVSSVEVFVAIQRIDCTTVVLWRFECISPIGFHSFPQFVRSSSRVQRQTWRCHRSLIKVITTFIRSQSLWLAARCLAVVITNGTAPKGAPKKYLVGGS